MTTGDIIKAVEDMMDIKGSTTKEVLAKMVPERRLRKISKGIYGLYAGFSSAGIPSSGSN